MSSPDTQPQAPLRKVPSWLLITVIVVLFAGISWLAERWRTNKLNRLVADLAQLDVEIIHDGVVHLVQGVQTGSMTLNFELESTGPIPATVPCGESVTVTGGTWMSHPIWAVLGYAGDEEVWHSYQIELNEVDTGTEVIVRAHGDLDCDGIQSTFLRSAVVSNGEVTGINATFIRLQLE